jgi:lysophospholipase L1-like esterase
MHRARLSIKKLLSASLFIVVLLFSIGQSLAISPEQRDFIAGGAQYFDEEIACVSAESNGKIYFLGDSLTKGMADQGDLQSKFESLGWTDIKIQATNGDTIAGALPKVDADQEFIKEASTVVIGLGTNREPTFSARVDELIVKLKGINPELKIFWTNVYTTADAFIEGGQEEDRRINSAINTLGTQHGFTVINWYGVAGIREGGTDDYKYGFLTDGVHHSAQGYKDRVDFIADRVGTPPAAAVGEGARGDRGQELVGATNEEQIFNYLIGKEVHGNDLKPYHVAGILGNMWAESAFRPQRLQGTGVDVITPADQARGSRLGWGLVQWTPAGKMINPLIDGGKDPNDMRVQLDFLLEQLNGATSSPEGPAGQDLIAATDVGQATLAFETKYERHAGPPQPDRIIQAQQILDSGFSGGGADECTGGDSDLADTVLEYAWPQYHAAPFTEKKPAYAAAISAAQADNQYVGGGSQPGVDCGGWVTRLMIDSGFEPQYNFGGKTADGAGNVSGGQIRWIQANWEKITVSGTQDLLPGDVAINTGRSHTFAWAGTIQGFESQVASASYSTNGSSWRSPMAGHEDPLASNIEWYRKK